MLIGRVFREPIRCIMIHAANALAPRVIQLFLRHGARTNIRLYDECDMKEHCIAPERERDMEELKGCSHSILHLMIVQGEKK